MAATFWKKPPLVKCTPSSLGSWSTTMTRPMPALKPVSTGSEMNLATPPSRNSAASSRMTPAITASSAAAAANVASSACGPSAASCDAVRMAMVDVVLVLSTREVPSTA